MDEEKLNLFDILEIVVNQGYKDVMIKQIFYKAFLVAAMGSVKSLARDESIRYICTILKNEGEVDLFIQRKYNLGGVGTNIVV